MTEDDCTDAVRGAGLPGWKASLRYAHAVGRYVAVLTSPDFNPVKQTGVIKCASGRTQADAFASVLELAQGCAQASATRH